MQTERPLASIVISSFNYERYLAITIASALNQTYDRCEVIVVDDGSTDGSRSIIAGFGDRVRAIYQANLGQAQANNTGFAATRGDIVIFVDSDDALLPGAAEEVVAIWRPGIAKVQFCLAEIEESGQPTRFVFPYFGPDAAPHRIRDQVIRTGLYRWPPTTGNAFAREFLEKVMPLSPEPFLFSTDALLNPIAPLYGDVVSINKPLGYYRVHASNLHKAPVAEQVRRCILYRRQEAELLRAHANKLQVDLRPDLLDQLFHLELRIASLKLAPDKHPVPGDTLHRLLQRAIRALVLDENTFARRTALLAWLIAVIVSPRALCSRIAEARFVPGARSGLLVKTLQLLGIVRRSKEMDYLPTLGSAHAAVSEQ